MFLADRTELGKAKWHYFLCYLACRNLKKYRSYISYSSWEDRMDLFFGFCGQVSKPVAFLWKWNCNNTPKWDGSVSLTSDMVKSVVCKCGLIFLHIRMDDNIFPIHLPLNCYLFMVFMHNTLHYSCEQPHQCQFSLSVFGSLKSHNYKKDRDWSRFKYGLV